MNKLIIEQQLRHFLIEDIGEGDLSSETVIAKETKSIGKIIAKENGVIAGTELIQSLYHLLDRTIKVQLKVNDGDFIEKGDIVASIEGPALPLLSGERVLLNLLQRLSGIATMTRNAVEALDDSTIRICDTRKTTPGLRNLEKYAVRCGGGYNHRFGLNDAVMLKENHILAGGGIKQTVSQVREKLGHMVKVEVETTNESEVLEAVEAGADVIMFDNATPAEVKNYIKLVPSHIVTEASGGINLSTLSTFKGTGVDYISLGFLTHSVKAIDLSLLLEEEVQ